MTNDYSRAREAFQGFDRTFDGRETFHLSESTIDTIRKALALAEKVEAGTHVVVPVEPTTQILKAMFECGNEAPWTELYKSMIATAQEGK